MVGLEQKTETLSLSGSSGQAGYKEFSNLTITDSYCEVVTDRVTVHMTLFSEGRRFGWSSGTG